MAREDFARVERDERDVGLIDDGEDATPSVGDAGVEVMNSATAPQGNGALAAGDVMAEAEVDSKGIGQFWRRVSPQTWAHWMVSYRVLAVRFGCGQ